MGNPRLGNADGDGVTGAMETADRGCHLVTFAEAAALLDTTVESLYTLKNKDNRAFPEPGKVDLEFFRRQRVAYDAAMRKARVYYYELVIDESWSYRRIAREVAKRYAVPISTTVAMLGKGLWTPIKRKQYYFAIPHSVECFIKWKENYYVPLDRHGDDGTKAR